jgi:hypothetical protein
MESIPTTSYPSESSRLMMELPMNPAAPVTNAFTETLDLW